MMNGTPEQGVEAALDLITTFSNTRMDPALTRAYAPGSPKYRDVWERTIDAAEAFDAPGQFTAFIGFEWTSNPGKNNLHRNVIFRGGKQNADTVVPAGRHQVHELAADRRAAGQRRLDRVGKLAVASGQQGRRRGEQHQGGNSGAAHGRQPIAAGC